jgi:hypothetical protein
MQRSGRSRWRRSSKEAAEAAARRQAELQAERQRKETEEARRQAELEAERQSNEAAETARRQAEIEAERQRKEAAEAARRRAELAEQQRQKEEIERIAAAGEAARKAAAETEATRAEEERRRITSLEPAKPDHAARPKAEAAVKNTADREALTRSLQTALNQVGCYRGEIDGQWSIQGRAALAQFAKLTKHELAVDEPSIAALEAVVARSARVCPLQCDMDKIERNGKCVGYAEPKAPVPKTQTKPKTGTANRADRPDARAYSRNYWPRRSLTIGGPAVTANTPYGPLTCRSYAPASRECSWR